MKRLGLVLALSLATLSHATRIVVNNDEWTFAETSLSGSAGGFTAPNDGALFALNVAAWLTEGRTTKNLLNMTTNFGLHTATFTNTLTGAGYSLTNNTGAGMTLAQLSAFDAVFVAAPTAISATLLTQYVNGGGNVYLAAGTGYGCEDCAWDPFLNVFGLDLGPGYNAVGSPYSSASMAIPVSGPHAILSGVDHLQMGNGNTIFDLQVGDSRNQIVASSGNMGLIAVYDGNAPAAVPEPGTMVLLALGLAGMGFVARRRK